MIYYLTGVDHAGKTTLARRIQREKEKINYIHSTHSPEWDSMEHYFKTIADYIVTMSETYNQSFVLDRWCLDGLAYKHFNEQHSNYFDGVLELYENVVNHLGVDNFKLIYCKPNTPTWDNNREEVFKFEDMEIVSNAYEIIIDQLSKKYNNCIRYDYMTDGKDIKMFLEKVDKTSKENI